METGERVGFRILRLLGASSPAHIEGGWRTTVKQDLGASHRRF
jgi:hypothetical protein